MDLNAAKQALRQDKRALRRRLSEAEQNQASRGLLQNLLQNPRFRDSQTLALYLASDGEISPHLIARAAWAAGKAVYLPVIGDSQDNTMCFVCYEQDTALSENRYGIAEPVLTEQNSLDAQHLDLVLLPLVAFDRRGGRLGMGGGYYDRAFAFVKSNPVCSTRLFGLAHHCQETEALQLADWDIPLSAVMTDLESITME